MDMCLENKNKVKVMIIICGVILIPILIFLWVLSIAPSHRMKDIFEESNSVWVYGNPETNIVIYNSKKIPSKYQSYIRDYENYLGYDFEPDGLMVVDTCDNESVYFLCWDFPGNYYKESIELINCDIDISKNVSLNDVKCSISHMVKEKRFTISFEDFVDPVINDLDLKTVTFIAQE